MPVMEVAVMIVIRAMAVIPGRANAYSDTADANVYTGFSRECSLASGSFNFRAKQPKNVIEVKWPLHVQCRGLVANRVLEHADHCTTRVPRVS